MIPKKQQKNFVQLLGLYDPRYFQSKTFIVKDTGIDYVGIPVAKVVMEFETIAQAIAAFKQWKKESSEIN